MGGYGHGIRQYSEDSTHQSGDLGDLILAVRKSVPTALAGAENEYSPLQVNDGGALRAVLSDGIDDALVSVTGRLLVDAIGTLSVGLTDPKTSFSTQVSIAPGGQATFDSTQISSGKTGHIVQVVLASTVPVKGQLRTVLNGTPSSDKAVWFTEVLPEIRIDKKVITQVESVTAGFDGFRAVATNLDASRTADIYCTFIWDEE